MSRDSTTARLMGSIQNGLKLLLKGQYAIIGKELSTRMYSTTYAFGLQRDLHKPFDDPEAKINIRIRPLREEDVEPLMEHGELDEKYPRLASYQRGLIDADISTCYVAVTDDDTPCYMQWLIGPQENRHMQEHLNGLFPELNEDEMLLEGAYMRPTFRGNGIMPAAMSRITSKATETGARWAITFVGDINIPSLKGCQRAGFSPYILRKKRWRFFRRTVTFEEIPAEMLANYHRSLNSSGKKKAQRTDTAPGVQREVLTNPKPKQSPAK